MHGMWWGHLWYVALITLDSHSVWEAYAIQAPQICLLRATLFVRVLAVDPQPFQTLLADLFKDDTDWEIR